VEQSVVKILLTNYFKENKIMIYNYFLILFMLILDISCISPDLKYNYNPSDQVAVIKYPININHNFSSNDNNLLINITNPVYTDGTIIEYDKESYFENFKYDGTREGLIALTFGVNIPIIIGEYIFYKIKYPSFQRKFKRGLLENKGENGSPLSIYKSPYQLSNISNEISNYEDKVSFSVKIDDLYDDIYELKKNKTEKKYQIQYNICSDLKNRDINNVDIQNCSLSVKNIDLQEIVSAISKSKGGTSLISKVSSTIKEEERQEKLRLQEEARQAKIREQEEARAAKQREQEYNSYGNECSLYRSTYSSRKQCALDCARAGYGIASSRLTWCLQKCDRCL
jgi:hypothetical protein